MKRNAIIILVMALQIALLAVTARTAVFPHFSNGYTCLTCHYTNLFLGIKGVDCLTCHKPGDPYGRKKAFTQADFADPFKAYTSLYAPMQYQSSHSWIGNYTVPKAGALPPGNPALAWDCNASAATNEVYCTRCHNIHQPLQSEEELAKMKPLLRMANDRDQMCLDCHRPRNTTDHTRGTHPVGVSYGGTGSLVAKKPDQFKNPPVNSNPSNPTSAMQLKDGMLLCTTCHGVHNTDSNSTTFDSFTSVLTPSAGYLLRTDLKGATATSLNICTNCHLKPNHNKKNQNVQCADCHAGHVDTADGSVPNVYLIRRFMNISTQYGKVSNSPVFYQYTGSRRNWNSSDPANPGVCQVCHSIPLAGYPADHAVKDNATVCMKCHSHANTFSHGAGGSGGGCEGCHGHSAGYEYGPGNTSQGKGTWKSHATHTQLDGGNAKGPGIVCGACHDTSNFPYFKTGKDVNGDGRYNLSETDVCDVCHSPGGTYDGVSNTTYGARKNWKFGIYSSNLIRSGKEKWCASCHDESPSVISGVSAPNVVGNESGLYAYGSGWGYYKTGHGLLSGGKYPAGGGVTAGAGLECGSCHDFSLGHIDGNARTFGCDNGCDSTEYRNGYRLKLVGGQAPMQIPLTGAANDTSQFRLCYSCHNSGPFVDPNNWNTNLVSTGTDGTKNRHQYHLSFAYQLRYPADYNYSGSINSRITCVNCHNVHGSTRLAMVNDGKLIGREPGLKIWYNNPALVNYNSSSPNAPNPESLSLAASTGTLISYGSSTNLCGHCHGNNNVTAESRTPYQNVQAAPTLDWTGQPGYLSDGVNPDSGSGAAGFTFRVKYTDGNNDPPTTYQVWIDKNDNGTYEENEKFDMSPLNPGDTNYFAGKIYTYTLALSKVGDSTLNYRFKFANAGGEATGEPASDHQFTVTNSVPILSWTGETHYAGEGVHPNPSGNGRNFIFRVRYTDTDNEAPTAIQVWVDKNDNGSYEADEKFDMSTVDTGDTTYSDGKLYEKILPLSHAGDGNLNYRFFASDGLDSATGYPTSNSTVTVTSASNNAPTLSWTGETDYITDGVEPKTGAGGGNFTFRVKYTDIDNDPPVSVQVWIDENDNGVFEPAEKHEMTLVAAGENDCTDGRIYTFTKILAYTGDGALKYRYYASDGVNVATGASTKDGSNLLTVVNPCATVCPAGGCTYTSVASAVTACPDGSYILVKDGAYSNEHVNFANKVLNVRSLNGAEATVLDGGGAGGSTVKFDNANSTLDGFTVKRGTGTGNNGGGIYIYNNSAPFIKNCIIKDNTVSLDGAGVWITGGSSGATIVNTKITGNKGRNGGGIGFYNSSGTLTISNSAININNSSTYDGAGVYLKNISTVATITNSSINNNSGPRYGGGMYAENARFSIDSSHVDGNTVTGSLGDGAGIFLYGSSAGFGGPYNCTIANTTINGNTGYRNGGGMRIWDNGAAVSATITNSNIDNNICSGTAGNGGGIHVQGSNAAITLSGSSVSGNRSNINNPPTAGWHGGGIYLLGTGQPIAISNSIINNNKTYENGGGIFAQDVTGGLAITGSTLSGNAQTTSSRNGGAINLLRTPLTVSKSVLSGNTANGNGGAIYGNYAEPLSITNSFITGNRAVTYYGGGIYLVNSNDARIVNSTFGANRSEDGGAVYFNTGVASVKNSIFWGDYATRNREIRSGGTLTVSYSDVQGGFNGIGNQYVEPMFVDERAYGEAPTSSGNYHILSGSPVINMGTNDEGDGVSVPANDIDGQARQRTAGDPADMGADEYVTP